MKSPCIFSRETKRELMITIWVKMLQHNILGFTTIFFCFFFRLLISLNITTVLSTCTPTEDNVIGFLKEFSLLTLNFAVACYIIIQYFVSRQWVDIRAILFHRTERNAKPLLHKKMLTSYLFFAPCAGQNRRKERTSKHTASFIFLHRPVCRVNIITSLTVRRKF